MHRSWLGVPLTLTVALFLSCSDPEFTPFVMVVPKGHVGPVWILLDPEGQDVPLVYGKYRAVIPADGVLRVRSLKPAQVWHRSSDRFSACYDDGSTLPMNPDTPEAVGLRGGGTCKSQTRNGTPLDWMPFFVGTDAQYHEYSGPHRDRMPLPPGAGW
jgi:hypothetical protein